MKAVLLLAVVTVSMLLPEDGDAWVVRSRRDKDRVKKEWNRLKRHGVVNKLYRRDLDNIDLNQDGALDQAELETMIGERHARDLLELMDAENSITLEEFKRNARELQEEDE